MSASFFRPGRSDYLGITVRNFTTEYVDVIRTTTDAARSVAY